MPFSVRLDDELRRRIGRLAKERAVRPSQLVREAIERYVEVESGKPTPYELAKELIGSVRSGDGGLSAKKGRELSQVIRRSAARRQTRRAH